MLDGGALTMDLAAASRSERRLVVISLGVAAIYVVALGWMFAGHGWLLDAGGRPILTDFVGMWSAGGLARDGHALWAYDAGLQHAAEIATIGHAFQRSIGWNYPPVFLLVTTALAALPYAGAFLLWAGSTLVLYGWSIAAISRRWTAAIVALAPLCVFACASMGQTGFLTAALAGFVLLTMDERPITSGLLLGLLTYKPQFGPLFPLVLAASGRWRVFGWAAASALGLAGLSIAVFGFDVFSSFLRDLPIATRALVDNGGIASYNLESVYGLARALGASDTIGWGAQGAATAACIAAMVWFWRGRGPMDLKAASLPVAAILATPYVLGYDLPLLAVSAAFLYRHRGFDRLEYFVLAGAALTGNLGPLVHLPLGLFASLAVAAVVGRRAFDSRREETRSPFFAGPLCSLAAP
ncbi:MAG TPA: glycosyltransferase family 87 protein [Caulobacteraceae bacterium]|nr:glycosyltransferase family 87 protein [Caulobacteraceae bacterium]